MAQVMKKQIAISGSEPSFPAARFCTERAGVVLHGRWQMRKGLFWVAVKELELSYYIGETLLFAIYTHFGNPKP